MRKACIVPASGARPEGIGSLVRPRDTCPRVVLSEGCIACSSFSAFPPQACSASFCSGLINGSFYAILSLGLAVIFGLLNIINFTHGAQYMMGAFVAWMCLNYLGINYWAALLLAPDHRRRLRRRHRAAAAQTHRHVDHLYGLLLTFGLALIIQGLFRNGYGSSGLPYTDPDALSAAARISASCSCRTIAPGSSVASLVVCLGTWFMIEKTQARRLPARRHRECRR